MKSERQCTNKYHHHQNYFIARVVFLACAECQDATVLLADSFDEELPFVEAIANEIRN